MLRSLDSLSGFQLKAADGNIGTVEGFLFEDTDWTVRFMVADTGRWLEGRKVLIPAPAFELPDREKKLFPVRLTREQIENSPPLETHMPVSHQKLVELSEYYGVPPWYPTGGFDNVPPPPPAPEEVERHMAAVGQAEPDVHLRSTNEIKGYILQARNGETGKIRDFIVNEEDWAIRYLVIKTDGFLHQRKFLVPAPWITDLSWTEKKAYTELDIDDILKSPEHESGKPVTREFEMKLYRHYGRHGYWE